MAHAAGPSDVVIDLEDLTGMALDPRQLEELVGEGGECVFNWSTREGYPVGVVVAYVYRAGKFWTNCAARRKRVTALRARPQSSVVVNKDGRSATFKGESVIHGPEDADWDEVKGWFYAALSGAEREPDNQWARGLQALLDSPHQVIIETPANLVVGFNYTRFGAAMQAAIEAGLRADKNPGGGVPGF